MQPTTKLLTVTEAAERLRLHRATLYRLISRDESPVAFRRFGKTIRIPLEAVEALESVSR